MAISVYAFLSIEGFSLDVGDYVLPVMFVIIFFGLIFSPGKLKFYGIFSFVLLTFTLMFEMEILRFINSVQIYPIIFVLSIYWFCFLLSRLLNLINFNVGFIVVPFVIFMLFYSVVNYPFDFGDGIEPAEFVENIYRIQDENFPFTYAIVSHFGTKVQVENNAWFMDWEYFIEVYSKVDDLRKLYDVVYVFVPYTSSLRKISSELIPRVDNIPVKLDRICRNYPYGRVDIYFKGSDIIIYRIIKHSAGRGA
jgi:hypothetical protein